jgi:Uma2 family endonuclease
MGLSEQPGLVTVAEFVNLPDPREGHLELHHGRIVLMPVRKSPHVVIQAALSDLLNPSTRGLGFTTIEFPFQPELEYEFWQADVGFVVKERWRNAVDYLFGAPDFVIDVLSPSNTAAETFDRQEICLSNGCNCFWTVDPEIRRVLVTGPGRQTATYDRSMSIPLPSPLNGDIPVAAIFKPPF